MDAANRAPLPVVGPVTHHSVELNWEEALTRANQRVAAGGVVGVATATVSAVPMPRPSSCAAGDRGRTGADSRVRVQLEQRDRNGESWSTVYVGFAKQFTVDNLDAWETYVFRVRFVDNQSTATEWSQELSVTTSKRPMTGEDLHSAINRQNVAELERILETKEAPINAVDKYGYSPLMQVAQKGYTDMIEMLVEHGADVNLQNEAGKTALMLASFAGKLTCVKELCYHGADKQLCDKGGSTALHWAMDSSHLELAEWLIDNGADIEARDVNGWTPLLRIAAVGGNRQVATMLMRAGAVVDATDKDGKTALMLAVVNNHLPLAEALLEHNADITIKNEYGKTAYDMAVSMDTTRLVNLFEAYIDKKKIKLNR
jgi:ankyrin repeat protein